MLEIDLLPAMATQPKPNHTMKSAYEKTTQIQRNIERATGQWLDFADAETLRRCEMTLHRWAEGECGNGNDYCSWSIERDENTGKTYRVVYPHNGPKKRYSIADRETGALKRVKAVCEKYGFVFYHQTDPRGCALYVGNSDALAGGDIHSCYCRLVAMCA